MNGNIYLIGGGEIGSGETKLIDDFVLTNYKKSGLVLFIGAASGDSEAYFETFKKVYGADNETIFITMKCSKDEFIRTTKKAKIIYLGGGSTDLLLIQLKEWDADKIFATLIKNGTDIVGMSAGAYVLTKNYLHEENGCFTILKGLGIISATILVHATTKAETESLKVIKLTNINDSFVSISERSALIVSNEKTTIIGDGKISRYDFKNSNSIKFAF